jgi:hypothetical protein
MLRFLCLDAVALSAAATLAVAQQPPTGGPRPRTIGPVIAASTMQFGEIRQIRPFADGHLLVNDGARRQIWLVDATLKTGTVVLDSAGGRFNSYGDTRAGSSRGSAIARSLSTQSRRRCWCWTQRGTSAV